jgi:thiamine pyrophosphokinase
MKPEKIVIYGGTNGRADHYLANLNLLGLYDIELVDEMNRMFVKEDTFTISTTDYVSFFHYDGDPVISLENFKYPLEGYYLSPRDNLCVSNEVFGEGEVSISGGRILVIISKEKAV